MEEDETLRRLNCSLLAEIKRLKEEIAYFRGPEHRAKLLDFLRQETSHMELELQAATARSELFEEQLKIQTPHKAKAGSKSNSKIKITSQEQKQTTFTTEVAVQSEIVHVQDACVGTEETFWWGCRSRKWSEGDNGSDDT